MKTILDKQQLHLTILRLSHQLLENQVNLDDVVFIGLQPRGVKVSNLVVEGVRKLHPNEDVKYGVLDITFYRDDIRDELHVANKTDIPFSIKGKKVILIDDVLYTGRSVQAAMTALNHYGRPESVKLLVLVDRRFNRQVPVRPDYVGIVMDALDEAYVQVEWKETDGEDRVLLFPQKD